MDGPSRWQQFWGVTPALSLLGLTLLLQPEHPLSRMLLFLLALALTLVAISHRSQRTAVRSIISLVEGLRDGDYGIRGAQSHGGVYAELIGSINTLAAQLQNERLHLHESLQLFSKTLASLDSAVFAFESNGRLRLINPAGERLLACKAADLLGKNVSELELATLLELPSGCTHAQTFPGGRGRWLVSHAPLRSSTQAGKLLVLQPVERAMREGEAEAFRRLIRVLSHEINNSMAPIISTASTLQQISRRKPLPADWLDDLSSGLSLISHRSMALQRFLSGYAQLARPPTPICAPVQLRVIADHVLSLLNTQQIVLESSADVAVLADRDQLEQVLINVLRNAIEANTEEQLPVVLRWQVKGSRAHIEILDRGVGLPASGNPFIPFFTTKIGGSGIGLALSRQIMEAHNGSLDLLPRHEGNGAIAVIELNLAP